MKKVALIVEFIEQNTRGLQDKKCFVKITRSDDKDLSGIDGFYSWADLKKEFPDFKSLLKAYYVPADWNKGWQIYAEKVLGYEGLYEDIDSCIEL